MKKTIRLMAVLFCILLLGAVSGCSDEKEAAQETPSAVSEVSEVSYEDDTVVGIVNGTEITRGQLNKRVDMLASSMAVQYQVELTREEAPDFYDSLKDVAFEDLLLGILLDEAAEKEGFSVPENELAIYMNDLKNYATSSGYTLEEYLQVLHADETDMKQEYSRNEFIMDKHMQLSEEIEITDGEKQEYYDANIFMFTMPAGMRTSHILVDTQKQAEDIITQLEEGADFAELAQLYSTDTASAVSGGDVGTVNEDTSFVPEFLEAALVLAEGEFTTEPVQSMYGYHIIKAGEYQEESVQTFEEVEEMIEYYLQSEKGQLALQDYAEGLKTAADIQDLREAQDRSPELDLEGLTTTEEEQ